MMFSVVVTGEVLGDAAMCLIRGRSCRHNLLTLACPGRSGARRHVVETLGSSHCFKTPSEPLPRERIARIRHRRAGAGSEPRSRRLVSYRELQPFFPWPRNRRRYRYMGFAGSGSADQDEVLCRFHEGRSCQCLDVGFWQRRFRPVDAGEIAMHREARCLISHTPASAG
jgi:hypothetical protein